MRLRDRLNLKQNRVPVQILGSGPGAFQQVGWPGSRELPVGHAYAEKSLWAISAASAHGSTRAWLGAGNPLHPESLLS